MPSFHLKRLPATLLVSYLAGGSALACEAARELAGFGKLYDQLLKTQSQSYWQTNCTALSANLHSTDAIALGRGFGRVKCRMDQPRQHTSRTAENLNYVDRLVASTGCDIEPINVTQSGDDAAETSASDRDAVATKDNPSKTRLARPALALAIFFADLCRCRHGRSHPVSAWPRAYDRARQTHVQTPCDHSGPCI